MEWDWKNILFLVGSIAVAVFMLYRAIVKKKWCPDIYGSGSCGLKDNNPKSKSTDLPKKGGRDS